MDEDDVEDGIYEEETLNIKDLSEEDRIARMGKPRLGETTKMHIRIKESKEFKVLCGLLASLKEKKIERS